MLIIVALQLVLTAAITYAIWCDLLISMIYSSIKALSSFLLEYFSVVSIISFIIMVVCIVSATSFFVFHFLSISAKRSRSNYRIPCTLCHLTIL